MFKGPLTNARGQRYFGDCVCGKTPCEREGVTDERGTWTRHPNGTVRLSSEELQGVATAQAVPTHHEPYGPPPTLPRQGSFPSLDSYGVALGDYPV